MRSDFDPMNWCHHITYMDMPGPAKYLLLLVAQVADRDGEWSISRAKLARLLGISRPTVYDYIDIALETGQIMEINDPVKAWRAGGKVYRLIYGKDEK